MKNLFTQIATVVVLVFSMSACKNDDGLSRIAPPNGQAFNGLRAEALASLTQTKAFTAEDGLNFESDKGATLTIHPGCLQDSEGNPVTGEATLTFVEIYDRGNMVMTNKPLMGRNSEGELEPLVTGGQFFVEVKQGNEVLNLGCPYSLAVDPSHTGGIDTEMSLWEGNIDEDGNLVWDEVKRDAQGNGGGGLEIGDVYYAYFGSFGWTNVDRFWGYEGPKTQIKVAVPNPYSQNNSAVYLAYEDQPGVLAQLDTYDTAGKFFSEHYGFVPVGISLHVIFTSESNGSIVYAIKKVTIADGATITITDNDLNTTTQAGLVSLINNLD